MEICIVADETDGALFLRSEAAFREIERVQQSMSFHDPESELTRVNQTAHLGAVEISADLWQVFDVAQKLHRASGGCFDPTMAPELVRRGLLPNHGNAVAGFSAWDSVMLGKNSIQFTVPTRIDLGGVAKGYAVDCALASLGNEVDATVNAGGDLAMSHWQGRDVEIRTPGSGGRKTVTVPMENRALATSASYFLAGDSVILHPEDGRPSAGDQSVSIFASSCMVADALTKVAMLMINPAQVLRNFAASGIVIGVEGKVERL